MNFIDPDQEQPKRKFADPDKPHDPKRDNLSPMQRRMGIGGPNSSADPVTGFLQMPYEGGGLVTDAASRIGASPEIAAGAGVAANMGLQAIPMGLGALTKVAKPVLQSASRRLMQSATKPTLEAHKSGDAAAAIETMLQRGYNPTEGGVKAMDAQISKLASQVDEIVKNSTSTVNKGEVGLSLKDSFNRFRNQVNPSADLSALRNAWLEFRSHPDLIGKMEIPVQKAQAMKQGTYNALGNKAYTGEMKGAEIEAQKGLARGLKEGINKAHPEVAPLNNLQGEFINARDVAMRRALMSGNTNILSLAPLGPDNLSRLGFLMDKSDLVKSALAHGLYGDLPMYGSMLGIAGGLAPHYGMQDPRGVLYDR